MGYRIAIDQGYGFTKAMSETKRCLFPSVIAPAQENGLDRDYAYGHIIEYRRPGEISKRKLFVGELAMKEGRGAQLILSKEKYLKEASIVMMLTAAYMVGGYKQIDLAVGLPLAYYKTQREETEKALKVINCYVSVDGEPERYICFDRVQVLPQGIGSIYSLKKLPEQGLYGCIDIGFGTTDFYLFECTPNRIIPLKSYATSIDTGSSTAVKLFVNRFQQLTGYPLNLNDAQYYWLQRRDEIKFRGRSVNIKPLIEQAQKEVSAAIAEAVTGIWSEKVDILDGIYLCGGGAIEFAQELNQYFPQAVVVEDPQWANTKGFFVLSGGQSVQEKTAEAAK
ncbi:MAG: ParM/StbA family protein [Syntrophothermus sp.]|uniref:ParM/StbA family protein n=1 Tax=Syntrophothermus sp. TaxID=2736299 RepID=UPI00257A4423|nr:ParM/StbA family protein [Syntrophothermus sp.]NSW83622.1 ParM/StbA family protein [Syntrophothermus sp.]